MGGLCGVPKLLGGSPWHCHPLGGLSVEPPGHGGVVSGVQRGPQALGCSVGASQALVVFLGGFPNPCGGLHSIANPLGGVSVGPPGHGRGMSLGFSGVPKHLGGSLGDPQALGGLYLGESPLVFQRPPRRHPLRARQPRQVENNKKAFISLIIKPFQEAQVTSMGWPESYPLLQPGPPQPDRGCPSHPVPSRPLPHRHHGVRHFTPASSAWPQLVLPQLEKLQRRRLSSVPLQETSSIQILPVPAENGEGVSDTHQINYTAGNKDLASWKLQPLHGG